jgi:amino-acid N-acetyltransferase
MALSLVQEPPSPSFPTLFVAPLLTTESDLKATSLHTRSAQLEDAPSIHQLIDSCTYDGTLLRRSYVEICENIRTFTIVEDSSSNFIGCAALHIYGQHLAEIRSIVVNPETKRHGAGSLLVRALLDQAEARGVKCVCLFTRIPAFFEHFQFRIAERQALRDKVMKDCILCARRNACDEVAMAVGVLPTLHSPPSGELIQLQL